jgi:hypothetical protein
MDAQGDYMQRRHLINIFAPAFFLQVGVRQAMLTGGLCFGAGFASMAAGVHLHSIGKKVFNFSIKSCILHE